MGGGESLKMQELPPLPAPGVEGASLAFGDWLALAGPQMSDIGAVSRQWWFYILQQVGNFYEQWLMEVRWRDYAYDQVMLDFLLSFKGWNSVGFPCY